MAGRTFEIADDRGQPLSVDVDEAMKSFAVANGRGDLVGTGRLIRREGRFEIRECSLGVSDAMMDAIEEELNGASESAPLAASGRN